MYAGFARFALKAGLHGVDDLRDFDRVHPGEDESGGLADPALDRYARLVCRTLEVPISSVTYVEPERQVNAGAVGLGEEQQRTRVVPLTHSFCKHVVASRQPLVVEDARQNPLLRDHPGIVDDGVIAYAGWPVSDGERVVGSICAIDVRPHEWTAAQIASLKDMADACSSELALRRVVGRAGEQEATARADAEHARAALMISDDLASVHVAGEIAQMIGRLARVHLAGATALLWRLDTEGALLRSGEDAAGGRVVPVDASEPVAAALRTATAWYGSAEGAGASPTSASAFLPLLVGTWLVGVLELGWSDQVDPEHTHGRRADVLARYAASTIDRCARA